VNFIASWAASKGHRISVPGLEAAISAAEAMPRTGLAAPYANEPPTTRSEFISGELSARRNKAASTVAWCYGVILAMHDAGAVRLPDLSISRAYSVQALQTTRGGDIAMGREAYDNGKRFERNQADRGKFTPVTMSDILP